MAESKAIQHDNFQEGGQETMFTQPTTYEQRSCTDRICLILGVIFALTVGLYTFLNISLQNQNRLSVPSDSDGKLCGIDYPNFPYIYFTDAPDISKRVCVKSCPKSGDSALQCVSTNQIGCQFSDIPSFTVKYLDTTNIQDSNGNFCMPTDEAIQSKIMEDGKLSSRLIFFKNYETFVLCILIAIGLSLLHIILVHFLTQAMIWITLIASLIVLIALAVIMFLYNSTSPIKIILAIVLSVFFLLYIINIILNRRQVSFGAIFIHESVKFTGKNPSTFAYIFVFFGLTVLFLFMMMKEYSGFVSSRETTFNAATSLYWQTSISGLGLAWFILGFQLLWGLLFLKQAFAFLLSYHTVSYYLKKGGGLCTMPAAWKLLILKHLGSVIGGAFVTLFGFIPDLVVGICRKKIVGQDGSCCGLLDVVRSDALCYVALSGNPYCNSAKYCEYVTYQSITSQSNQSVIKLYRIAAHILIAGSVSILGLYIKGSIDPYTIGFTLIIGLFVCTYLISYQADPAEAYLMMYLIDQEYGRRGQRKINVFPHDRKHQQKYITWLTEKYASKNEKQKEEVANKIKKHKLLEWIQQKTEFAQ